MNLKRSFEKRYQRFVANRALRHYKYVHLMFNDKFNKPFVDFLNKYFDEKEHLILCKQYSDEFPFPDGSNVIEMIDYVGLDFSHANIEKIICHSLFDTELVNLFYDDCSLLNKSYWVIWGGDFYGAKHDEKNNYVRRNFKGYVAAIEGDEVAAKKHYNSSAALFNATVLSPITHIMLQNIKKNVCRNVTIQINCSANKTTLGMLEYLHQFKEEDICVVVVVSYGNMECRQDIVTTGKTLFGSKIKIIDTILSPIEYVYHLSSVNILFLCNEYQECVGNCMAALSLGTKVFLKPTVTTYEMLKNRGYIAYNIDLIKGMSFSDLIYYDNNSKNHNIELGMREFKETELRAYREWNEVFQHEPDSIGSNILS